MPAMFRPRPEPFARRAARHAVAVLALVLMIGATAPQPAVGQTPGQLPTAVIPTHYAIDLALDPDSLKVDGFEVIDIEVREPTARIVLNADEIKITRATVDRRPRAAAITYDNDAETVTLTFPRPLEVGHHKLRIAFTTQIHRSGDGLYYVDYRTDGGSKRLISSHMAPADARRAFPVWDEPSLKATFALTVTVPRAFTAVSNMPVEREEPAGPNAKKIAFMTTPKMSSYLVQLTAGELEQISGEVDGVAINVFTTAGKREQGRFALQSAIDLLRYFNDYFGLKYPLPKLDLIAIPNGSVSAMEHWGAITFRENYLLFDPRKDAPSARRGIFALIAHEIAHQWFGNLVTMTWWDNLWLNEGFATWMESKATEHFHPRWQTWLNNYDEKESTMRQDANGTAHPISRPVTDKSEASEMFDDITYNKAGAVVRMLEGYLGPDVFRAGVRKYVADHAYGNTTPADLWRALEAVSGKPVTAVATAFIKQSGVPLVIAEARCIDGKQRVTLRQERFTLPGAEPAAGSWQIPITVELVQEQRPLGPLLLTQAPLEFEAGRCGEAVKLNVGNTGYYRVQYDEGMRAALIRSFALLKPADRVNLLADTWALVEAGRGSPTAYLELVEQIGDDSRPVWDQVIRVLKQIDRLQHNRSERATFQTHARAKLRPVLDRIGWGAPRPEGDGTGALRAQLVRALGQFGDEEILTEAKHRFAAFQQRPESLRPSLRDAVVRLAGIAADRSTYDALLALARKSSGRDRESYYAAAASARDPVLAQETLNLLLANELPSSVIGSMLGAMASDGGHAELAWSFVRKNFRTLADRQGSSFRNYFVPNLMKNFSDRRYADELAAFSPMHANARTREAAKEAEDDIRLDADLKARVLPAIDAWIKRRTTRG
jgi:aminopeptidase N